MADKFKDTSFVEFKVDGVTIHGNISKIKISEIIEILCRKDKS